MKTALPPIRSGGAMSAASTAASTTAPAPSNTCQKFEARRSNKASGAAVKADGATWKERLAVCEGVTDDGQPSLKIRSYFRNHQTRERVWDEPPSGASEIIFSTPEMRKHAEQQMKELQLTLDLIPPDFNNTNDFDNAANNDAKKKGVKKNGVFGLFKKRDKEKPTLKDDSKDLNLQKAIARSMVEQHGGISMGFGDDEPVVYYDPEASLDALANAGGSSMSATLKQIQQQEQDDIALAQALSMSAREAAAAAIPQQHENMSEDEMFQRAIEASRLESLAAKVSNNDGNNGGRLPPLSSAVPDNFSPFDPYSPHAEGSSPTSQTKKTPPPTEPPVSESSPPQKLEADQGLKNKPASRVFGGRKKMQVKAGLV